MIDVKFLEFEDVCTENLEPGDIYIRYLGWKDVYISLHVFRIIDVVSFGFRRGFCGEILRLMFVARVESGMIYNRFHEDDVVCMRSLDVDVVYIGPPDSGVVCPLSLL